MADGLSEYHHDNPHPEKVASREAAGVCRELVDTRPYLWRELCTIAQPGDKRPSAGGKGSEELTKGGPLTLRRTAGCRLADGSTAFFVPCWKSATLPQTMLCCVWIRMLAANSYDRQIGEAARVLADGGVVAYPTDTVYGLGADIHNPEAIERVFEIKGRPADAPLPVLLSGVEQLTAVVDSPPNAAYELADRFWPGALTLVMRTSLSLPSALLREGRVAVRVPDDPMCRRLIERLGSPITGTSANKTGGPAATAADEVRAQLGDTVDYILDAGRSGGSLPSTVVEVDEAGLRILREGAIPSEDVLSAWSELPTRQGS